MNHDTNEDRVSVPIDIPETLAQALEAGAAKAGVSLNNYICKLVSEYPRRSRLNR
jgi:predicted HicB family RNase H-like nuclease